MEAAAAAWVTAVEAAGWVEKVAGVAAEGREARSYKVADSGGEGCGERAAGEAKEAGTRD